MIQIDHVTFSYGEETEHTGGVRDIELQIKRGEFAVLCGESGCGKTTITRLINGLIPHYYEGKMSGGVWVNGAEVSKQPLYDTAKIVGSVFQNPRSQFFNVDTTSEITFGCENLGQPAETIRARLERTVCDAYYQNLLPGYGQEYADTLMAYMPDWILPVLLAAAFVSGLVGGLIGRKLFKKHFERAGIVS